VKRKSRQKKGFFLLYKHKTAPFSQKREFSFFFLLTRIIPPPLLFPSSNVKQEPRLKEKKKESNRKTC